MAIDIKLLDPPEFRTDPDKHATVVLSERDYISLLIRAGVTDPELWPPSKREGAEHIARIRQLEASAHGPAGLFDWEALSPELQDEYDVACNALDRLIEPGDRGEDAADFFKKLRGA